MAAVALTLGSKVGSHFSHRGYNLAANLLRKALKVLSADQIWVNPDCGLKTRGWKEVEPALTAMVDAAKDLRGELAGGKKATA